MNKHALAGLSSLLLPFAMYAPPGNAGGAYQRSYLQSSVSRHKAMQISGNSKTVERSEMVPAVSSELSLLSSTGIKELVIIDAAVPEKYTFYQQLKPGVDVVELASGDNGLEQLITVLSHYKGLHAVHIVSHAEDGVLLLGGSRITADMIHQNVEAFASINGAIRAGGDLLFYGCDLAGGAEGEALLDIITSNTNVDVAASNDASGSLKQGADWDLEIQKGYIQTSSPFSETALRDFSSTLAINDATGKTITTSGFAAGYANTKSYDVDASGYVLQLSTSSVSANAIYCGFGYCATNFGGALTDTEKLYIEFSGGKSFDIDSLQVYSPAGNITYVFTPSTGVPTNGNNFHLGFSTKTLNFTNINKLTITRQDGGDLNGFDIDNLIIKNAAPQNLTPTISIDNSTLSFVEGNSATQIDSAATVSDADGDADWNGGTLVAQITANTEAADVLSIPDNIVGTINTSGTNLQNGATVIGTLSASEGTVTSGTALTITFNANATNALVQQVVRAIHYRNSSSTPGTSNRTVTFTATDTNSASANDTRTISVTNTPPAITSATYNAGTGALVVTGTGFSAQAGALNDVDVSKLIFSGEGGSTYTLTSATDVEITSATEFTVTLAGVDKTNVAGLLNKDGASSDDATTYNLAAADDFIANETAGDSSDATNGVTVSGVAAPIVTSATYDASTGALVVTGTNFVNYTGASNDIAVNTLTLTGEAGGTYTLTSSNVEITSATAFTVSLNATDALAVNGLLNKNGTSSDGSTTYNLAAADNWMQGAATSADISDTTLNGITVSNVTAPAITSATYDAATGALVVTGTKFVSKSGATNDIDVTKLTLTGEGSATRVLTTSNVEVSSATAFTVTLNAADKAAVNQIINKNGVSSTSATTYNLAAAEDWAAGAAASVNVVDATNAVTVSNVAAPTITSATYDASSGVLAVTGTGFLSMSGATNDIVANKFTLTGEGGATYTLTDSANVEISSGTAFSLTLSATDKAAVNLIINKNGTTSTSATAYNLNAAEDWAAGADAAVNVVDATANGITASNVAVPTITSATYDYNTNVLVVTGTGFLSKTGATNDIDISKLTFTGEGGATYTLTSASDVEITSATQFSITLSATDMTNVEGLLNKDGSTADGGTTYNLAAAEDWAVGADAAVNVVDATGNGITISNYSISTITSATYDWSTGQLVITGTEFVSMTGAINDVDASLLTFTGEGGTYALTDTSDVEVTSATAATVTLSATDKLNVHGLLNKNGTASSGATTYNLAAADNWMAGSPAGLDIADATGNSITVSNVAIPSITSMTYDSDTGVVVVTGTNLFKKVGANNDVDLSKLTFTGGTANATYTLTTATDVEITSATSFTFTLSGADKTSVDALLDQIGTTSSGGSTYNIAGADDWLTGADVATDISDATGSATVSINPKITSSTYNPSTGALVVTGTNIQANGGGSDIDASLFTVTGEGSTTYTLTDTADVERTSATQFTLTLSATDKAGVNALLNNAGTSSADATTYNLAAADDWNTNVTAGDTSDSTASITVPNTAPTLTNLHGDTATFNIAGAAVNFDNAGNATFSDLTSPDLSGGNVTASIIVNGQPGEDQLLVGAVGAIATSGSNVTHTDSGGLTMGTFVGGTGGVDLVISLNANATPARVQDLIRALQYFDSDGATINTAARVVTITVDDGDGGSSTSSGQDVVVNLIRAPIIDLDGDDSSGAGSGGFNGSFSEDGGAVVVTDTDTTISDNGTFKALTMTITNDLDGVSESLSSTLGTGAQITTTSENVTIAAYNSGTGVLSITVDDASATAATMQELMQSIRYNNSANVPDTTARSITFTGTDNEDNDGPVATANISMIAANDAPAFTGLDGTPAFTEGGASAVLDANVTVADPELDAAANYNGASLTLARNGGANASDQFSDSGTLSALTESSAFNVGTGDIGTVTTNSGGTLVLTFNASATAANVDSVLQQIAYSNSSDAPAASVQIDWSFSDGNSGSQGSGGALVATGSTTAAITAVNDAPSITSTASTTATAGSAYTYSATVTDPDDANDGTNLTWSLTGEPAGMTVSSTGVVNWTPTTAGSVGPITLQVVDGGENGAAAATENFSITVVAGGPPPNNLPTGSVTISGVAQVGERLTAANTLADADGLGTISYQWSRNGSAIVDATRDNYVLQNDNQGTTISVTASYTDGANHAESVISAATASVIAKPNVAPIGSVTISGDATQGQTLSAAQTLADTDGLGVINYQWQRDGVAISGATGSSYTLTSSDVGKSISVTASYTDARGAAESVGSNAIAPIAAFVNTAAEGSVSISGTTEVGQTLTASNSLSDVDGLGSISYQWLRNGSPIDGATGSSYVLTVADEATTISVSASFTDAHGTAESKTSAATATISAKSNAAPTGDVSITGTTEVGETLSASNSLTDADGLGSITYQWNRNGSPITGSSGSSYALTDADLGATISVTASYTDGAGTVESKTSAVTTAVSAKANAAPTGSVTIGGTAEVGETLTASNNLADTDGLGTISYQWNRNGSPITGVTGSSYAITETDLGATISVTASYTDAAGNAESVSSAATSAVLSSSNSNPVVTAPDTITVNATGLFTEVDLGTTATAIDEEDGDLIPTSDSSGFFSPGAHTVTWTATDSGGRSGTATQTVNVIPLVEFSKKQDSVEGSTAIFKVILNGPAVTYPVIVPYSVSGTAATDGADHDLTQEGSVIIVEDSLETSVSINIVDDGAGEGMETLIVTIGEPSNAVKGANATHQVNIYEGNVAPDVTLSANQGDGSTRIISQADGVVVVTANVTDPNSGDTHSYDWSGTDNALSDRDSAVDSFSFDPGALAAGVYIIKLNVSDNSASGAAEIKLNVIDALPTLTDADDIDGDGVNDEDEGIGDDDGDGIPDYLDAISLARNVVQEKSLVSGQFLMETEPGLSLSLGEVAFRAGNSSTEVKNEEITMHANNGTGASTDDDFEYSGGIFDFNVEELPVAGQSVSIVIPQLAAIPENAVYRKLMPSGWQDFVVDANNSIASVLGAEGFCPPPGDASYTTGLTQGHWCVQLSIEDGGPNDADSVANNAVEDPGGVAQLKSEPINITITGSGGGSLSVWLLAVLGLFGVARIKGRKS